MSLEWLQDPESWRARPFKDQCEALRNHFCTGPCGQSMSVLSSREELNSALKRAAALEAENKQLRNRINDLSEELASFRRSEINKEGDQQW